MSTLSNSPSFPSSLIKGGRRERKKNSLFLPTNNCEYSSPKYTQEQEKYSFLPISMGFNRKKEIIGKQPRIYLLSFFTNFFSPPLLFLLDIYPLHHSSYSILYLLHSRYYSSFRSVVTIFLFLSSSSPSSPNK